MNRTLGLITAFFGVSFASSLFLLVSLWYSPFHVFVFGLSALSSLFLFYTFGGNKLVNPRALFYTHIPLVPVTLYVSVMTYDVPFYNIANPISFLLCALLTWFYYTEFYRPKANFLTSN